MFCIEKGWLRHINAVVYMNFGQIVQEAMLSQLFDVEGEGLP
jgi:hypothetical protein